MRRVRVEKPALRFNRKAERGKARGRRAEVLGTPSRATARERGGARGA